MKSPQYQYDYCTKRELGRLISPLKQQAGLQAMACDGPIAHTALQTQQVLPLSQH